MHGIRYMSERSDPEKALEGDHGLGFEPEHPELSQAAETPAARTASERPLQAQGHCLSPRDHLLNLPCKENPLNVALKDGEGQLATRLDHIQVTVA